MTETPEFRVRINEDEDRANIIVVDRNNKTYHADDKNANFGEILRRAKTGDFGDRFLSLFSMEEQLKDVFSDVSERVSIAYGQVYFDKQPVENVLTQHILRSLNEGTADHKYLIKFWENIEANPSKESRDNLMDWLAAANFTITMDGMIVGYKGLNADGTSIHAGPGIVNGVEMVGNIPNEAGSVIEMDRSKVDPDRRRECSYGMHVGVWEYAEWFSRGRIVAVHVNPRDVVAVPKDHDGQKMRVSKYKVIRTVTAEYGKAVSDENDWK